MKTLLKLLLLAEMALLIWGFYTKQTDIQKGDVIIGSAVVMLAFVLMPFFLYTRYKDKKLSEYMFPKEGPKKNNNRLFERSQSFGRELYHIYKSNISTALDETNIIFHKR